jgi:hypothetical protein
MAMWTMAWWYRLGLTPNLSTRALWQLPVLSGGPFSRDIYGANRGMDEGNENLVYPSPWDFKRSLTYRKILRQGTSGFTSRHKEGVLRIFIALKNASPWLGSNPRHLGPVARALTTTPPRKSETRTPTSTEAQWLRVFEDITLNLRTQKKQKDEDNFVMWRVIPCRLFFTASPSGPLVCYSSRLTPENLNTFSRHS